MTRLARVGLLLAVFAGAASAARADWIVTRDGGKFEIKGSWQMKGKMVVFSLPNGTLSSLRSDKVDLDASQKATEKAKKDLAMQTPAGIAAENEREQAAKPKKPSVWVLTDKDFKKSEPETPPANGNDAAKDSKDAKDADRPKDAAARATVPAAAGSLQVVTWDRVNPTDGSAPAGVQLSGKVRNALGDMLTDMAVMASFYDEGGALVASRVPAVVATSQLGAGETTTFTVTAPGVFGFAAVKFETQGKGFKLHTQPAPAAGGTATPEEPAKPAPPPPG